MTRDDIIRMAREALLPSCHLTHPKALERFAAIVAAAERDRIADEAKHIIKRAEARGAAAEREECAQVCEAERERLFEWGNGLQVITADKLTEAIRARGEK
jgi:DNA invertase Pin-like site-specific DNA recombinase